MTYRRNRLLCTELETSAIIPAPALGPDPTGIAENRNCAANGDLDHLRLANGVVVATNAPHNTLPHNTPPANTIQNAASTVDSARMAIIIEHKITNGIIPATARKIALTMATSTAVQYDRAWNAFARWCEVNGTNPLSDKKDDVVNFLYVHYVHSRHTLNIYKSAIASMWNVYLPIQPLAERPEVKALFANKRKKGAPPPQQRHILKVSDTIQRLEPDDIPELLTDADLASRTAFLMALATILQPRSL
ncbi:hypothetical protein H4R24_002573 [Coemansia sp. RSA 988]|nr:hypothetical protein H4R24_002573 [Coemansia sp. RSA 988]